MTKTFKYKDKYGVKWVSDDGETWFANSSSDAFDTGIWSGVTTEQLNNPNQLVKLSASKIYWNKYL